MTPTQQQSFLIWIEERIKEAISRDVWDDSSDTVINELSAVKEKFESLINEP